MLNLGEKSQLSFSLSCAPHRIAGKGPCSASRNPSHLTCSQVLPTVEVGGKLYCPSCGAHWKAAATWKAPPSLEQETSLSAYLYMCYLLPEVTVINRCHTAERNVEHFWNIWKPFPSPVVLFILQSDFKDG